VVEKLGLQIGRAGEIVKGLRRFMSAATVNFSEGSLEPLVRQALRVSERAASIAKVELLADVASKPRLCGWSRRKSSL
jgi:hypothetical protein